MSSKKFLITRPDHDYVVTYLYHWSAEVLNFANEANIKFSDFKGQKANRGEVGKYLEKQGPELVIFNGHGTPTSINGHRDEPLIISDENESLLKSKITYAIACDAAADLGEKIIEKGGRAFIGYAGPFSFVHDASRECNPSKDRFAEPFKKMSNEVIVSLLRGKSIRETYERSQKRSSDLISEYSASDSEPGYADIRFWLFWDKYYQKVIGEDTAKF